MAAAPSIVTKAIKGEEAWTIDWREHFRKDLSLGDPTCSGQMRGFHIVFTLRMNRSGRLQFWEDDGSIIRRNERVVHEDRTSHELLGHEIEVRAGDRLQIAQWQQDGDWIWAGAIHPIDVLREINGLFRPYLDIAVDNLKTPNGPPLKMYFSGTTPIRTLLSLYSMLINGYRPSSVLIFGD
jgi:hypothetical protein